MMSRKTAVAGLALGVAVSGVPGRVMAQAPSPGDRVRVVSIPDQTPVVCGTFERMTGDSVWLVPTGGVEAMGIPLGAGARLEQSRRRNSGRTGALVGMGIGAGATIGAINAFGGGGLGLFLLFAVPPTAAGVVIGSLITSEHWEVVPLISSGPNGGMRLGLLVRL